MTAWLEHGSGAPAALADAAPARPPWGQAGETSQGARSSASAWRGAVQLAVVPLMFGFLAWLGLSGEGWLSPAFFIAAAATVLAVSLQAALFFDHGRLRRELFFARQRLQERIEHQAQEAVGAESRLRSLTESASDAIITTDEFGRILSWNRAARRIFGYSVRQVAGKPLSLVLAHDLREDFLEHWAKRLDDPDAPDSTQTAEASGTRNDGAIFPIEYSIATWQTNGEQYYGAIIRDITERKRNEDRLTYYAEHDGLTGLFNRRRMEQELGREVAAVGRTRSPGALLFLDLDRFKSVNDNFGHRSGDQLLVSIAALLREHFGETAILSRLSGDEFAILLPQRSSEEAVRSAEAFLERLRPHRILTHGQMLSVTASVGVALLGAHGFTVEELLVHADQAMYSAKERRDRVALYSSEREGEALTYRRPWEQRMREALELELFVLYLQPIQDRTGAISRYEVPIRLVDPDGQVTLPGAFLDTAEHSGLIRNIDRWIVRKSMELLG